MKLIHCADMHLDSKLNANLSPEKAKERKREILDTFINMVEYAKANDVEAILIAGDLFDTKNVSALARNTLVSLITKNPQIGFYYLRGNHDEDALTEFFEEKPDNLFLFNENWTTYSLSNSGLVKLYGVEFNGSNAGSVQISFTPDPMDINIVMLHGQESESSSGDKTEVINLRLFKNKGIDYMALGHVHAYKREQLDGRCTYCYSGCLEGRGFDETGDHGFVLLEIDEEKKTVKDTFVSFAGRKIYEIPVDVSGLFNTPDILNRTKETLERSDASKKDLVKVVLTGEIDIECEKDVEAVRHSIESDYYFVKVYDKTVFKVNPESYMYDSSLKGEFVRAVLADDALSEEDKGEIVRIGLDALMKGAVKV